jgi:CBS domain-containing protein
VNTGQIVSIPAVTVPLGASLEQAAQLMLRWHTGAVVITENIDGNLRVAGILTDRDIVRARLKHSGALSTLNVADVMTAEPLVLEAHLGIDNALRNLQARAVRRAPVVDRDGALLGVVSTDDLLRFIAAELTGLAQLVTRQTRTSLP